MAQSILIVDDEKEIVSMLYCYFSKLGYTVYTATAGNAALKEVEKKPDIILLDVNMPDIDGFTVCERIRDYVSCPIIFLTARIEDSDKIKLLNIVCKNIEFYINQWDDIKHFNSVSFSPQKFYLAEKGIG